MRFIKFNVGGPFNFYFRRGGDDFSMEFFGQPDQRLHDALYINYHRFHRTGEDGEFLVQKVAGGGNALAHQNFIGRAANPGQIGAARGKGGCSRERMTSRSWGGAWVINSITA